MTTNCIVGYLEFPKEETVFYNDGSEDLILAVFSSGNFHIDCAISKYITTQESGRVRLTGFINTRHFPAPDGPVKKIIRTFFYVNHIEYVDDTIEDNLSVSVEIMLTKDVEYRNSPDGVAYATFMGKDTWRCKNRTRGPLIRCQASRAVAHFMYNRRYGDWIRVVGVLNRKKGKVRVIAHQCELLEEGGADVGEIQELTNND